MEKARQAVKGLGNAVNQGNKQLAQANIAPPGNNPLAALGRASLKLADNPNPWGLILLLAGIAAARKIAGKRGECPAERDTKALYASLGPNPLPVIAKAQAHHLFPVSEFNTLLGRRLCRWGIDLNSADNGV